MNASALYGQQIDWIKQVKNKPVIDIRQPPYNAKCDGTTNDTTAINSAIAALSTAGGGEVIIPAGNFCRYGGIILKSNVTLTGGGKIKLIDNYCATAGSQYPISNLLGGVYQNNSTIKDLYIDSNDAANDPESDGACDALTLGGENVRAEDLTIVNVPDSGIMFSQATNSTLRNIRIKDGNDLGIYVNDGDGTTSYGNIIDNVRITGFPYGGVGFKRVTQRVQLSNFFITDCGNGITLENASTSTDYATNLSITDGWIRHIGYNGLPTSYVGVDLRESSHVILDTVRIEDVKGMAILAQSADRAIISNINISGVTSTQIAGAHGISIQERDSKASCTDCIIKNIIVKDVKGACFNFEGTQTTSGNIISNLIGTGCGTYGMSVSSPWTSNHFSNIRISGTTADLNYLPTATNNLYESITLVNGTASGSSTITAAQDYSPNKRIGTFNAANLLIDTQTQLGQQASGNINWGSPAVKNAFEHGFNLFNNDITTYPFEANVLIDANTLYIAANSYYASGAYRLFDAARAPSEIRLHSENAAGYISFHTRDLNAADPPEVLRVAPSGDLNFRLGKGQHILPQASNNDISGVATLTAGSATVTFTTPYVGAAPICVCTSRSSTNPVRCDTDLKTIAMTGTGSDQVSYICFGN